MRRVTSLAVCLFFLGAAIATVTTVDAQGQIERPGCRGCGAPDDAKSSGEKAEPAKSKSPEPDPERAGAICLQYLLYADDDIAWWIADHYLDDECATIPIQEYHFTTPDKAGPQVCGNTGFPQCMGARLIKPAPKAAERATPSDPSLETVLATNESFLHRLTGKAVKFPDRDSTAGTKNLNTVWHPESGLEHGEIDKQFVKVEKRDAAGEYIVIRLSDGVARQGKIDFADNALRMDYKLPNRVFAIGFETSKRVSEVGVTLTAKKLPRIGNNTAVTVEFEGITYHVLTKTPVKVAP